MRQITLISTLLLPILSFAQESITLDECYTLLNTNYPLLKQAEMNVRKNELDRSVIEKNRLPTMELNAQATYQSDVTHVAIDNPMFSIAPPNKDQYKATLTVNQLIYNGGVINDNLAVTEADLNAQQKQLEVSVYQLKKQVNQLYFSILLLQEKQQLIASNKDLLSKKLAEINSGISNGAVKSSAATVIEVELLKLDQLAIEVDKNKESLLTNLSKLIGKEITSTTELASTAGTLNTNGLTRPELDLFQLQKDKIERSETLFTKKNLPKVFGFAMGGYGNPGLNMLDNTFQPYYMVGMKLNWSIFDWNMSQQQRQSLAITKELIDNQQEVFELNTSMELEQQQIEMDKIAALIESDEKLIALREKLVQSANAELNNGTITPSAYATELNNLFDAQTAQKTHEIQFLLAKANYNTIKGN